MKTIEIPVVVLFTALDEDEIIVRSLFTPEVMAEEMSKQQKTMQAQVDAIVAEVRNAARDAGQTPAEFIAAAEASNES